MNLRELLQKRSGLVAQARALIDLADREKRGLTAEEETQYNGLMDEVTKLGAEIDRRQQLEALEHAMAEPIQAAQRADPGSGNEQRGLAGIQWRSRGMSTLTQEGPDCMDEPLWRNLLPFAQATYASAYRSWLRRGPEIAAAERRALQADSDISGGYLAMPIQLVDRLLQAMDNLVYVRQWATIFSVPQADSLGVPSLDTDSADPAWTSELAIGTEDSSMAIGKRELHPHPLAKYIKLSRKLLRMVPSVEDLVIQRLGYKFGVVQENNYLNGTGAGQPLGVFTASNDGIPTSRDVSTGNTVSSVQFDGLIEAKYTLKQQYWPRARWLFHSSGVKQIAKLQDGDGQYIWSESVRVGEPDRLLGFPIFMSEYAPSTFTTGLYVGVLGDFSYYWIADAMNMEMQRLVELFAATNQVGLVGRLESDGQPVMSEAFVRVKLA
jgi:HK97 family phage major capsid protein